MALTQEEKEWIAETSPWELGEVFWTENLTQLTVDALIGDTYILLKRDYPFEEMKVSGKIVVDDEAINENEFVLFRQENQ